MKEHFKKALAAAKGYFSRAKHVVSHLEGAAKAALVAAIGGGVETVAAQLHQGSTIAFSAEKFVELKAHFISGAFIAFVFWLKQAPALKPKSADATQPAQ